MQFGANPQPTKGEWTINNVKIPVGSADAKGKYTSGSIEKKVLANFYAKKFDICQHYVLLSTIFCHICLFRMELKENGKLHLQSRH